LGTWALRSFKTNTLRIQPNEAEKSGLEGDSSQNGFYVAFEFEVDCPNGIPNETK